MTSRGDSVGGTQSTSSGPQPGSHQHAALTYMSPYMRNDFSAQETLVEIFPKFELGRIHFMNGEHGPFSPNYPVAVPLWLALFLRETNTCSIRPPEDVSVTNLQRVLDYESDNDHLFHPLPLHFFSVVRQILRYAAADIPDAAVVHRLLEELEQRRIGKITKNIGVLATNEDGLPPRAFSAGALTMTELLVLKSSLFKVINDGVELRARAEHRVHGGSGAAAAAAAYGGGAPSVSSGGEGSTSYGRDTMSTTSSQTYGVGVGVGSSQSGSSSVGGDTFADSASAAGGGGTQQENSGRTRRTLRG